MNVTVNLAASNRYVSYQYKNNRKENEIKMSVTGSGKNIDTHVLLPENVKTVKSVTINNKPVEFTMSKIEGSDYVDFNLSLLQIQDVVIKY